MAMDEGSCVPRESGSCEDVDWTTAKELML